MSRIKALVALMALGLTACGAIGGGIDSRSEGDEVRDRARLAGQVNQSVTDRIDGANGDNTDWKYLDVFDKGDLTISVRMDAPEGVEGGEITLHDDFGARLDRQTITAKRPDYYFKIPVNKKPSKYYIKVFALGGTSAYTVGSQLRLPPEPPPPPPPTVVTRVEPPPPPPPQPKRRKRTVRRRTVKPPPPPPPPPPPTVDAITARVFKVIDSGDGGAVLTMKLSKAGAIRKGMQGRLSKNGSALPQRVVITSVNGKIAKGKTNVHYSKLLTGSIKVRF
ncbi:MAG: hypothetical protein ACE366_31660 [Bradymonadia bacterium]